jgi:hypothetical protein
MASRAVDTPKKALPANGGSHEPVGSAQDEEAKMKRHEAIRQAFSEQEGLKDSRMLYIHRQTKKLLQNFLAPLGGYVSLPHHLPPKLVSNYLAACNLPLNLHLISRNLFVVDAKTQRPNRVRISTLPFFGPT